MIYLSYYRSIFLQGTVTVAGVRIEIRIQDVQIRKHESCPVALVTCLLQGHVYCCHGFESCSGHVSIFITPMCGLRTGARTRTVEERKETRIGRRKEKEVNNRLFCFHLYGCCSVPTDVSNPETWA